MVVSRTLVLVKPDGVKRGLIGDIISRFEKCGLKIVAMKMLHINEEFSKKHYSSHAEKDFYKSLEKYLISGPVIAIVLEGIHAVENVRKIVGSTEPNKSTPGTIRGDYAHISNLYSDNKNKGTKNLVHASGNIEEAKNEIKLWFNDKELHTYKTLHESHLEED